MFLGKKGKEYSNKQIYVYGKIKDFRMAHYENL